MEDKKAAGAKTRRKSTAQGKIPGLEFPERRSAGRRMADQPGDNQRQMTECMASFTRSLGDSTKRLELFVYPSLFAFVVLAAYGFFLIFNLAGDISKLADNVTHMTTSMTTISDRMVRISNGVRNISDNMQPMRVSMSSMEASMRSMDVNMENMDRSTRHISVTSSAMNHQMGRMNQSMGPMRAVSSFMPW